MEMPIITDRWSELENKIVNLANVDVVCWRHFKEKKSGLIISTEEISHMWECILNRMCQDGDLTNFTDQEIMLLTTLVAGIDIETEKKMAEMRAFTEKNVNQMEEYYGFKSPSLIDEVKTIINDKVWDIENKIRDRKIERILKNPSTFSTTVSGKPTGSQTPYSKSPKFPFIIAFTFYHFILWVVIDNGGEIEPLYMEIVIFEFVFVYWFLRLLGVVPKLG